MEFDVWDSLNEIGSFCECMADIEGCECCPFYVQDYEGIYNLIYNQDNDAKLKINCGLRLILLLYPPRIFRQINDVGDVQKLIKLRIN